MEPWHKDGGRTGGLEQATWLCAAVVLADLFGAPVPAWAGWPAAFALMFLVPTAAIAAGRRK
jgi:hypothetical protein